jgi:hypothetical protein
MVADRDIYRAAKLLIGRQGGEANRTAAEQSYVWRRTRRYL